MVSSKSITKIRKKNQRFLDVISPGTYEIHLIDRLSPLGQSEFPVFWWTDYSKYRRIDLIHDGRHVEFAIIIQISYTLQRGKTTQVREVITNI